VNIRHNRAARTVRNYAQRVVEQREEVRSAMLTDLRNSAHPRPVSIHWNSEAEFSVPVLTSPSGLNTALAALSPNGLETKIQ
jgi:hypothetical protein